MLNTAALKPLQQIIKVILLHVHVWVDAISHPARDLKPILVDRRATLAMTVFIAKYNVAL